MSILGRIFPRRAAAPAMTIAAGKVETLSGRPRLNVTDGKITAGYDAAKTTPENRKHWGQADGLSADAANSPAVREILRNRATYESSNNGYLKGQVKAHAVFVVGRGPKLQMLTDNPAYNRMLEKSFKRWAKKIKLGKKLRLARKTKIERGEAVIRLVTNSKLNHPVKLDLQVIECDRLRSEAINPLTTNEVDGIIYDTEGLPAFYKIMKRHPGGTNVFAPTWEFDTVSADNIIHLYDWERPEQSRGIPEITSSLPLFAYLRRYTLATVNAAESAALHSGIIKSQQPAAGEGEEDSIDGFNPSDTIPVERGMYTVLPEGWDITQQKAEHPTTTYKEFKGELVTEAARPLLQPSNIAKGDSSGYNYSSGRLDHQTYFKANEVEQDEIEGEFCDRVLEAFLAEALLVSNFLPREARKYGTDPDHNWFWDGTAPVDDAKAAQAQQTRLQNGTTTLQEEGAAEGVDWEERAEQQARERDKYASLKLRYPGDPLPKPAAQPIPADNAPDPEEEPADA